MGYHQFAEGELLYKNNLSTPEDIDDWKVEGEMFARFKKNTLFLKNKLDPDIHGDKSHWVFWCPVDFPDNVMIQWEFCPIAEPGLCMMFFAATGRKGEDIFDQSLPNRTGVYPQYHSGAINALHLSYFRHKQAEERAFRTCNLRKSFGFHLVAHGADPLPPVTDVIEPYHMKVVKYDEIVQFSINELPILEWEDDGQTFGPVYKGGKIGIRQMAPMEAAYSNFTVHRAVSIKEAEGRSSSV
ncbi:hypothetical protein J2S78_000509 [Salibacterium salarium]|uniref:DUF1961 family protein n=1 Tax=Salibacterium salarium TaxID=284579 RepID=UPI002780C677|nr:DUF1961 family protein [Salibacterium salarium]MDQ0298101.1 hypothetical protein [Salibacterium salarium]